MNAFFRELLAASDGAWDWPRAVVSGLAHDGDTVQIDVDLGRGLWWIPGHSNVRLAGINAPEIGKGGAAALASRDFLRALLPIATKVRLISVNYDKFKDRVDAVIELPDGRIVNELMVASGNAVHRDYGLSAGR